jgi:nucleotide-binding universal stress UspA family protein
MINKILVAYDGSDPADKAFDYALEFAQRFSAELDLVSIIRPPEYGGGAVEATAIIEAGKRHFAEQSRKLHERARKAGVDLHGHSLIGHPADQIVRHAADAGVSLIVMGHRGRSAVGRWLTGSIAVHVIAHAHCPVLVVR